MRSRWQLSDASAPDGAVTVRQAGESDRAEVASTRRMSRSRGVDVSVLPARHTHLHNSNRHSSSRWLSRSAETSFQVFHLPPWAALEQNGIRLDEVPYSSAETRIYHPQSPGREVFETDAKQTPRSSYPVVIFSSTSRRRYLRKSGNIFVSNVISS